MAIWPDLALIAIQKEMVMRKALMYSKRLEKAGLTRTQAEVHLEILEEVIENEMATKNDIRDLKAFTASRESLMLAQDDIGEIRVLMATREELKEIKSQMVTKDELNEIKAQMATKDELNVLNQRVDHLATEIKLLESRVTIKLGLMLSAAVLALSAIIKLL